MTNGRKVGYSARSLLYQVGIRLHARPLKAGTSAAAAGISLAALFIVAGLAETGSRQVSERFDARRATYVSAQLLEVADPQQQWIQDRMGRLDTISGLVRSGYIRRLQESELLAEAVPISGNLVAAVGGDSLAILDLHQTSDTSLTSYQVEVGDASALVGVLAMQAMTSAAGGTPRYIFFDGVRYTIQGTFDESPLAADLLSAIVVPDSHRLGEGEVTVLVEVNPGAAAQVAERLPLGLQPENPKNVFAVAPPDPVSLRRAVAEDIDSLLLALGLTSAIVAVLSIGATIGTATKARMREFGIRRAMGARSCDLRRLVLFEAALVGLLAGALGLSVGVFGLTAASAYRNWSATVDARMYLLVPSLGLLGGFLGGLGPAIRAASVNPISALKSA